MAAVLVGRETHSFGKHHLDEANKTIQVSLYLGDPLGRDKCMEYKYLRLFNSYQTKETHYFNYEKIQAYTIVGMRHWLMQKIVCFNFDHECR